MKFSKVGELFKEFKESKEIVSLTKLKDECITDENYKRAFEIQAMIENKWRDKVRSFEFNN